MAGPVRHGELEGLRQDVQLPLAGDERCILPSGDRRVAGLLLDALAHAGHRVQVASTFRTYDGDGDAARQRALRAQGEALAEQLAADWKAGAADDRPELWFTYHLYYKAPDWLGPRVAEALSIPYVVAEASVAGKRRSGPWRLGHAAIVSALGRADAVVGLNSADRAACSCQCRGNPEAGHADRNGEQLRRCVRRERLCCSTLSRRSNWSKL